QPSGHALQRSRPQTAPRRHNLQPPDQRCAPSVSPDSKIAHTPMACIPLSEWYSFLGIRVKPVKVSRDTRGKGMLKGSQSDVLKFLESRVCGGAAEEIVRTHISIVVLQGNKAWKLKRPVRLTYADFSNQGLRLEACERELHLNRRTAADM